MKQIEWSPPSGQDAGKKFVITRMSAFAADRWARHAVKALIKAGAKISDTAMEAGIVGMGGVAMQMFGQMDNADADADAAFEALLGCVQISRAGQMPSRLLELDIDDPQTLSDLYAEAFKLHVGFFKAAAYQVTPIAAALFPPTSPENSPQS